MSGPSTDSDAALALGRRSRSPWWRKDTPRRNTWHAPACTFLSSPIALRDKPYPLPNARGALAFRIVSMPPLRSAHGQALRSRDSTRPDYLLAFWQRRGRNHHWSHDATATLFASGTRRHGPRPLP